MHTQESGFTLIELLVVIAIIGILGALGLTTFNFYKSSAAYATAESTLHDARNAIEASMVDADDPPDSVALIAIREQGPILDPEAANLLPGLNLPTNTKFQVAHDPDCLTSACQAQFVQVNHCLGKEFVRWIRFGDGLELKLDRIAGDGCP